MKPLKNFRAKSLKKIILFLFFILLFLLVAHVRADLYVGSQSTTCKSSEIFKKGGEINPDNYNKITETWLVSESFLAKTERNQGYCIDAEEYCSKNKCSLSNKVQILASVYFHFKNLTINLLINSLIILLFFLTAKIGLRIFFKLKSLGRLALITILGYLSDILAISFIGIPLAAMLSNKFCFLGRSALCGGTYYKSPIIDRMVTPLSFIAIGLSVLIVFALVSFIFYKLYSKILTSDSKKRIIYSIIFGIISNPIWYILYKIFLR
jgi:uncharacterized membrane protein